MSESLYEQALKSMDGTIRDLAGLVPEPKKIAFLDSFVYRYSEKTHHQAIVQKLARYLTTLRAAHLLMENGYVQEQATLQRVLDETEEDITFLSFGIVFGEWTQWHEKYLSYFYEEDVDLSTGRTLGLDRPMVLRKKIRAFIARLQGKSENPSGAVDSMRTLSKAYSGYVHAASPHIMDMYGGNPPMFHVCGMRGTPLYEDHRDDLWNYFYRGILAFAFSAKAFGKDELFENIKEFAQVFAESNGRDYGLRSKK